MSESCFSLFFVRTTDSRLGRSVEVEGLKKMEIIGVYSYKSMKMSLVDEDEFRVCEVDECSV